MVTSLRLTLGKDNEAAARSMPFQHGSVRSSVQADVHGRQRREQSGLGRKFSLRIFISLVCFC